ncbi:MAG: hypothetical protein PHE53_04795 [Thermoguttaceae bacterium]|nr:hypothetical protein [Thermoguttaceae bacterium]
MVTSATFPKLRLLIDPIPRDGAVNLAIDMSLLEAANRMAASLDNAHGTATSDATPILRFYRWIPTLSLGHFQSADAIPEAFFHANTLSAKDLLSGNSKTDETLELVKRPSGGGAILHQYEWTYALILPSGYDLTFSDNTDWAAFSDVQTTKSSENRHANRSELYSAAKRSPVEPIRRLHRVTAAMLRWRYHLDALLYEEMPLRNGETSQTNEQPAAEKISTTPGSPFLCFERRAPEDVVVPMPTDSATVEGTTEKWRDSSPQQPLRNEIAERKTSEPGQFGRCYKILGSAMRLRRGARLLHGSFLLRHSPWTPQLLGVADLIPRRVSAADRDAWEMQFLEAWQAAILTAFFAHWQLDRTPLSEAEWAAAQMLARHFALPS